MPSRRSGARSHSGCTNCKQRRVKCDETVPACLRCQRHGRICSIAANLGLDYRPYGRSPARNGPISFPVPEPYPMSKGESTNTTHGALMTNPESETCKHSIRGLQAALRGPDVPDYERSVRLPCETINDIAREMSVEELTSCAVLAEYEKDLFNSYITEVAHLLHESEDVLSLFKITAPTLALSRPYLMYAILAISGTHHLCMRTGKFQGAESSKLHARVLEYRSQSLRLYQAKVNETASTDDCVATCMACIFILLFSLTSVHADAYERQHTHDEALDKACQALKLQAGISAVFQSRRAQIEASALKPLLQYDPKVEAEPAEGDLPTSLNELEKLCSESTLPLLEIQTYSAAIEGLRYCLQAISRNSIDIGNRLGWVMSEMAQNLADLVATRKPEALLVLAHWAALLSHGPRLWWDMGFGQALLDDISHHISVPLKTRFGWLFTRATHDFLTAR